MQYAFPSYVEKNLRVEDLTGAIYGKDYPAPIFSLGLIFYLNNIKFKLFQRNLAILFYTWFLNRPAWNSSGLLHIILHDFSHKVSEYIFYFRPFTININ